MLPSSDQGFGILLAGIGIGILLAFAGRAGWRHISVFGLTFNRPKEPTPEELRYEREQAQTAAAVERRQIETAFSRYSEAAVGMVAMVTASGPADESLGAWFDVTAAALAAGLTRVPEDHFRVAIWADLGDPDRFALLGSANHDKNDLQHLSKEGTIGGHAWRSKPGEYLCVNIAKDRKFKSRSKSRKPYQSVFAIRVGEAHQPWGVMTIDAPRASDFSTLNITHIRRFARLISAGASVAIARYGPTGTSTPRVGTGPKRIVARSVDPIASEGETSDDQS